MTDWPWHKASRWFWSCQLATNHAIHSGNSVYQLSTCVMVVKLDTVNLKGHIMLAVTYNICSLRQLDAHTMWLSHLWPSADLRSNSATTGWPETANQNSDCNSVSQKWGWLWLVNVRGNSDWSELSVTGHDELVIGWIWQTGSLSHLSANVSSLLRSHSLQPISLNSIKEALDPRFQGLVLPDGCWAEWAACKLTWR